MKCDYLGQKILQKIILYRTDIKCDGCEMFPIQGSQRHKCNECEDFDLCKKCILIDNIHPPDHHMRIEPIVKEMSEEEFQTIVYHWHLWSKNLNEVKKLEYDYLTAKMPTSMKILKNELDIDPVKLLSLNNSS